MDDGPVIRKYSDFDEMKADEYRYGQSRPAHERLDAVEELIRIAYELKGWKIEPGCTKTTKTFCPPSSPMALNTSWWAASPDQTLVYLLHMINFWGDTAGEHVCDFCEQLLRPSVMKVVVDTPKIAQRPIELFFAAGKAK